MYRSTFFAAMLLLASPTITSPVVEERGSGQTIADRDLLPPNPLGPAAAQEQAARQSILRAHNAQASIMSVSSAVVAQASIASVVSVSSAAAAAASNYAAQVAAAQAAVAGGTTEVDYAPSSNSEADNDAESQAEANRPPAIPTPCVSVDPAGVQHTTTCAFGFRFALDHGHRRRWDD